jgi:hypothetical protein
MIIPIPIVIINFSGLINPIKSKADLYQPDSSRDGSETIEIKGIIAEIPSVSTREKPIVNISIIHRLILCLRVINRNNFEVIGFKNKNFSNRVM